VVYTTQEALGNNSSRNWKVKKEKRQKRSGSASLKTIYFGKWEVGERF